MNEEALKKLERLERDVRVQLNLIDKQSKILDELVARIEVQCREDITHIEIKDEGIFKNHKRVILCSKGQYVNLVLSSYQTMNEFIQSVNALKGFKLTIDNKHGKLPVSMLPSLKQTNLQTNNCLIIVKL